MGQPRVQVFGAPWAPATRSACSISRSNALRLSRTPRHCGTGLDRVALLLEDEHVVAMLDHVGDPQPDQRAQVLAGGASSSDDLAGAGEQRLHQLIADADQQLLLGAEVVIQRRRWPGPSSAARSCIVVWS